MFKFCVAKTNKQIKTNQHVKHPCIIEPNIRLIAKTHLFILRVETLDLGVPRWYTSFLTNETNHIHRIYDIFIQWRLEPSSSSSKLLSNQITYLCHVTHAQLFYTFLYACRYRSVWLLLYN